MYLAFLYFKAMTSFCYLLVTTCIYTYVYTHIFLNILLSFYDINCMCIFRADHFVLDDKLMCSSLGRAFPTANIAQLPVVLCGGWSPPGFISVHFSMPMVFVLVQYMFRQTCWWDFMRVASENIRRHSLTENFVIFWLLKSFCSYFWMPIDKNSNQRSCQH